MSNYEAEMDRKFKKLLLIFGGIILSLLGLILIIVVIGFLMYKPILASYYYNQAVEFKDKGFPKKSKDYLKKAINLAPDSETAKKSQHFMKTKLPKSDNYTDEAVYFNNKGFRYNKNRDYDKAKEYYLKSIDDSPDFEWPYSNLAMVYYYNDKNYDEAISFLNKALELNPDYFNALNNIAKVYWGKARDLKSNNQYHESLECLKKSLSYFKKARDLEPDDKLIKTNINDINKYVELLNKLINESKKN